MSKVLRMSGRPLMTRCMASRASCLMLLSWLMV